MKRILVSLLSKYLQPSFLFIKEMEGKYDQLLFVTTREMEDTKTQSSHYLDMALGNAEPTQKIIVRADDYSDIQEKLNSYEFSAGDTFIVNPTGGTKVMAIAVFEFFRQFENSQFYYIPEGKNEVGKLYSSEPSVPLKYRLNLKEYFTLNRLSFECQPGTMRNKVAADGVFEKLRRNRFNRYNVPEIKGAQFLPSNEDKVYYSGQWLEEYVYYKMKTDFRLPDDCICQGAKIYREGIDRNNNEIDVMFVYNNMLYIIECKLSLIKYGKDSVKPTWDGYMYKLAAIAKDFGLRVNSYIMTLHRQDNDLLGIKENAVQRMRILGIKNTFFAEDFAKGRLNMY